MSDINIQELDKSKIYLVTVPDDYGKKKYMIFWRGLRLRGLNALSQAKV